MIPPEAESDYLTESTFTPDRTRDVLETACRTAGYSSVGAKLLRHHTNAVYALSRDAVVVKIGRPGHSVGTDVVGLVRWLEQQCVPTVELADTYQPLIIGGCPVTFWQYLHQERGIRSAAELATPLARLHSRSTLPADLGLPRDHIRNSLLAISRAIDSSEVLADYNRDLLGARLNGLAEQAFEVRYELESCVIHGDIQHRNALWDEVSGCAVLCDWESAAIGPPEWDLVTIEVHCRRFGHPSAEYQDFSKAYGLDIREWSGYTWLRDLRELRMITTNARKCTPGTAAANEVLRRVEGLREGTNTKWNIL